MAKIQPKLICPAVCTGHVGVDIPDCNLDPDNSLCADATEGMRIANYYNDTFLCDPCYLSVFWWRINSPFLPDSDYSDYLVDQFQDIQDVCNVTVSDTILRVSPPGYAIGVTPNYTLLGSTPPSGSPASSACLGQTLSTGSGACDTLSTTYGVTTGDLQQITNSTTCTFSGSICVPNKCALSQTGTNASCDSLAASLTTSTLNITDALLLSWNPNIQGLCDSLTQGQYVCIGPPGGTYNLPAPIGGDTTAAGQQRGGQGSGANPDGPLGATGPTVNSTSQAPTQEGINPNCTLFAYAAANDTCYDFTVDFSITLKDFTSWNPILGYPDGANCTTKFWSGYDYCVQVNGSSSTTTTSTSSQTSSTKATTSLPYPTQSGITPSCNKYAEAVSGDYCYVFAQEHNITTDELYAWNQILGPNGANCSTQFQAGVDYCVGVSSTSTSPTTMSKTPTSTTPTSTPVPTQSGLAADCVKIVEAKSGDYCYEFAQNNAITTTQLYTWNPILGSNGAECSTEFQAGVGYCVAVSS
ncbi:hypothetical protein LTR78_005701 [Recurvomyces mirabilis]|uniref:LysM domain-containing protein n=1 Tax=Recurvomyces mirabilis TaxID=574656 RepID=A0AAE1C0X5_9PEZI|nr:hypothetical protein LTR78_005701 [Recurvomyces mirabilis]KAK5154082.1 hypothetical protein LTS14_006767 [Recurvomyces mirabilis]